MSTDKGYIKKIVLFSIIFLLIVLYFFFAPFHKAEAPKEEIIKVSTKNGISVSIKHTISTLKEGNKEYKLDIQKPILEGFENRDIERHINTQISDKIDDIHADFKKELSEWVIPESMDDSSTLFITATTTSLSGKFESVEFSVESFMTGSAHPSSYEVALNFDVNTGKIVSLGDVLSGDYLRVISKYCKDVLGERFAADYDQYEENFGKGSDPIAENYENFLITTNGLVVVFDQYQVAAGVAGKQNVLIPWNQLSGVVKRI